jgi:hypothetical protein
MKLLKSAGLVLSLALIATAFLAVGSASAEPTKLCKVKEEKCSKANVYTLPASESLKATIGKTGDFATLVLLGLTNIKCTGSGKMTVSLAETTGPLTGELVVLNASGCSGEGCSLTATPEFKTGFAASLEMTTLGSGRLTLTKSPTMVVKCSTFTCTYSASQMRFQVLGGGQAVLTSEAPMEKVAEKSGAICPNGAVFQSHYSVIEPGSTLYVTH